MPFMVIYRTSDGSSCFEQSDAIDEAALFVERLRNSEGIDQIRIYRMEEISFAFRPYYKVELGPPDRQRRPVSPVQVDPPHRAAPASAGRAPAEETAAPAAGPDDERDPVPEAADPVPESADPVFEAADPVSGAMRDVTLPLPPPPDSGEAASTNGRRGLFGR
jgi:hypothetical protein